MRIYGQVEKAALEVLSADPTQGVQGRFWFNSTSLKFNIDDGSNIRSMLRNDQKCVFGNNGTANSNIRLQRGAAAVLQFVQGGDTTAEGSLSTSLAQISAKHEGYANASKPANGNAGRGIWITDTKVLSVDDGVSWLNLVDVSTAQTLTNKTLTTPAVDAPLFTDQAAPSAPVAGKTIIYTNGGHLFKIANGGTATQLAEVGVTNSEMVQLKTGTYTATTSDDAVVCSSTSWSLTIYTAVGNAGKRLKILHQGTSLTQVYTLLTTAGQTIGGIASGSYALYTNGEELEIESDGTNWLIFNHYTTTAEADAGALAITSSSAYTFTLSGAATITAGTVYTANGNTFIVSTASVASVTLLCYGTGSPGASGTLVFVSGSPSGNKNFNSVVTSASILGAATFHRFIWYRTGKYLNGRWEFQASGAGTAGTGMLAAYYPANLQPDATNITADTEVLAAAYPAGPCMVGQGWAFGSSVPSYSFAYNNWPTIFSCTSQGQGAWSPSAFAVTQNTSRFSLMFRYPVIGWQP